jgi:putative transposase
MAEIYRKPLHRFERVSHLHEWTFSCFRRKPLLTNDVWRSRSAAALNSACVEERFQLMAFVFIK